MRRMVALKVIKLGMDTRAIVARFEAERQALALMDHPNIAAVFDAGVTKSGRPYFVMELVKGVAITEYCDQAQMTVQERLGLFMQVCSAVQHAHQKGIIHRDIKPSNILVTLHDGVPVPKVIDFGIAKATAARLTEKTLFTQFGQMIGTPLYMSPEQAEMSGLDIDTRSDIYSLGVLLYELLTGTTPFSRQELAEAGYGEMQRLIRDHQPPKPSTRISTLDTLPSIAAQRRIEPRKLGLLLRDDLDWIIMKALEKDRTRRYPTADGFADDIRRHLHNEPVVASPPSAAYRLRKYLRRNRRAVMSALVVLLLLLGGIVGTGVGLMREREARKLADQARRTADSARQAAEEGRNAAEAAQASEAEQRRKAVRIADELEKETRRVERTSYSANLHAAQSQLDDGNFADAQRLLALCPKRFRNWEWAHIALTLDQSLVTLTGNQGEIRCVAWSPDGHRIISGGADNVLRIWDAESGKALRTLEGHTEWILSVSWSPDGKRIASGSSDATLRIWDAANGKTIHILEEPHGLREAVAIRSVSWSPDGKRIVSLSDPGIVDIWDADTGARLGTQHVPGDDSYLSSRASARWSPVGGRIAVDLIDGPIYIFDADPWKLLRTLPRTNTTINFSAMCWNHDGTRIVSALDDDTLCIWNVDTGKVLHTQDICGNINALAWSPHGNRIAWGTDDPRLRIWDLAGRPNPQILVGHAGSVTCVSWSPDGTRLVSGSADKTLRIWNATSGGSVQAIDRTGPSLGSKDFLYDEAGPVSVAWSPNGGRIASVSNAQMRIWDATSGDRLRTLEGTSGPMGSVAWSPEGSRIVTGPDGIGPCIWDAQNGRMLQKLGASSNNAMSLAWSPDGRRFVCLSFSGHLMESYRISEVEYKDFHRPLTPESSFVISTPFLGAESPESQRCIAWSPDAGHIVTGSQDGTLNIWNATSFTLVSHFEGYHDMVASIAWSPDGRWIASGSRDGTARILDAATGECAHTLLGHQGGVNCVAWSPDGNLLASASADKTLRIWDAQNGNCLQTLRGHEDGVNSVAWCHNGNRIVSGSADKTLRIWDVESGLCYRVLHGHDDVVTSVTWSPAGNRVASGSWDGTTRIWDAHSGNIIQTNTVPGKTGGVVATVAWQPDGNFIAWLCDDDTRGIDDVKSSPYKSVITLVDIDVSGSVALSPDGHRIASTSKDGILRVWNMNSGKSLHPLPEQELLSRPYVGSPPNCVAWSPDGNRVASDSGRNTVLLWDVESGQEMPSLVGHSEDVTCVAWCPDGSQLVSGSEDRTLRIWDAKSGKTLHTLEGHGGSVLSVAWSPDGGRIVSASEDKTLRIWDPENGECLLVLRGHEDAVYSVAWSHDGNRIVSASEDGTLRIWESRLEDALPFWKAASHRKRVETIVDTLFEQHILLEPVLSALQSDPSLPTDLYDSALVLARSRGNPSATDLDRDAWALVRPDRESKDTDVKKGLRLAEAAVKLSPQDSHVLRTLAWAFFANGRYEEALAKGQEAIDLASEDTKESLEAARKRLLEAIEKERSTATDTEDTPASPGDH